MQAMSKAKFRSLSKRDFDNGAVKNEIEVALEQRETALELLETAWGVITNCNEGDWEGETRTWQAAAKSFRDKYHQFMSKVLQ